MTLAVVTGGAGFIGSHLTELLIERGLHVRIIDDLSTGTRENVHPKAELIEKSILDVDAMAQVVSGADYVFHFAALPRIQPSFDEPELHERVNVIGTLRVFAALRGSSTLRKLVVSASSACYGTPDEFPTTEDAAIRCLSPYALQKYAAEQNALILGARFGVPVVALRYFNVYGPRSFNRRDPFNAYSSVLGIFHNQVTGGQALTVTGSGLQERDFVHVRDVARANFIAATSDVVGRVYNVGSGQRISILEIARLFDGPITHIPEREGEAVVTCASIERIKAELGWEPEISLQQGLKLLV